jgi:hypothetical protein
MSTRITLLYQDMGEGHSLHIYRESFSDEVFICDDANRIPHKLTEATARELRDVLQRVRLTQSGE